MLKDYKAVLAAKKVREPLVGKPTVATSTCDAKALSSPFPIRGWPCAAQLSHLRSYLNSLCPVGPPLSNSAASRQHARQVH
jgi:hypothetical protein